MVESLISFSWIPHLDPNVDLRFHDLSSIIGGSVDLNIDDSDENIVMHVDIGVPDEFHHGATVIPVHVRYGDVGYQAGIMMTKEGLMAIEMNVSKTAGCRESEFIIGKIHGMIEQRLGVSNLIDSKNHVVSDNRCSFLIKNGENVIDDAVMKIFESMMYTLRCRMNDFDDLAMSSRPDDLILLMIQELMIHESYRSASIALSHAMNYVNLFYGDDPTYSNSLRIHRETLDSIYASHCNTDSHVLNNSFVRTIELMEIQNQESSDISRQMRLIAIAALLTPYLTSLVTLLPVLL